jgi:hydroxyacyl-ACP dehydratase HTD2-like protein with hotdog domain
VAFIDEARDWVGREFDTTEFEVLESDLLAFARACGESDPRFVDPSHPDFQAPPTYTARFLGRRVLPENFPQPRGRSFDAGKSVEVNGPVHAGDVLIAHSRIHDVYQKTGRSGEMTFVVHRMEFENQRGEIVSVVDWRMVRREG